MQQLARLYVSQFGTDTAWYDHLLFDLTDPETNRPTDVIFHLENAGGKTSLLSFIFSCFDPRKERWLQHLQKKAHRLEDYFCRDGRLAFICMEWWVLAGLKINKIIIGQAVVLRDNVQRGMDAERCFFAFTAGQGVELQDIPAPGLCRTPALATEPARTMQDFMQWMQRASSLAGDMFCTRVQDDWLTHLSVTRRLDMDLLRMQVDFNNNEGGMEEEFLTFHSEEELLRRFFSLIMETQKVQAVRDTVAQTVDMQRLRPMFLNRETQLTRLLATASPFAEAATEYETGTARLEHIRKEAMGTVLALQQRRRSCLDEAERRRAEAEREKALAADAETETQKQKSAVQAMHLLRLERAARNAEIAAREAVQAYTAGVEALKRLQAAGRLLKLREEKERIRQLESDQQHAMQEVEPFRERAERQGALLRAGLRNAEQRCLHKQEQATAAVNTARAEIDALEKQKGELTRAGHRLAQEQGKVQGFLDSHDRERQQLVKSGILTTETTAEALESSNNTVEKDTFSLEFLVSDKEKLEEEELRLRDEAARALETAAKAGTAQAPLLESRAAGQALREALEQDATLRMIVDAEVVNPDSPALMPALEQLQERTRKDMTRCEIEIDGLREDLASIEETGLSGRSADTDTVVRRLREAGIASARAANTYVAELCPDADEARSLVLSDPARFLGVNVAQSEWRKTQELASGLTGRLSLPVTVAVASLTPALSASERLVLPPRNDAAYNKEAARQADASLTRLLDAANQRLSGYKLRAIEADAVRGRLRNYQTTYGAERLSRIEAELKQLCAEESKANERHRACLAQVETIRSKRQYQEKQLDTLRRRLAHMSTIIQQLESFQRTWEQPLTQQRTRMDALHKEHETLAHQIALLAQQQTEYSAARDEAVSTAAQYKADARTFVEELAKIEFGKTSVLPEEALEGQTLDALRQWYADARTVLNTEERNRLGVLGERLQNARDHLAETQKNYDDDFGMTPQAEVEALLELDLEAAVQEKEHGLPSLRQQRDVAGRVQTETRLHLDLFVAALPAAGRRSVFPAGLLASPEMNAMTDEALLQAERTAEETSARLVERKKQAEQAAEAAGKAAECAETAAQMAQSQCELLQAAVPGEVPEVALSLPENAAAHVSELIRAHREQETVVDEKRKHAETAFRAFIRVASSQEFSEAEPTLSHDLADNPFDMACLARGRLLELIHDRLCVVRDTLNSMEPDFEKCADELLGLTNEGIALLVHACDIKMPATTPYVGDKHILKMRNHFGGMNNEARKERVRQQLSALIAASVVPSNGADLAARCLLAISGRHELGLHVLTMEQNVEHQYQPVGELKGSKGQGAMLAMFLYLIISQLRDETRARAIRGGGPLILDNPFAKVQSRPLVVAQQLLARQIGVQLIFFTASADANILAGFRRIIRLRKAGVHSTTGRSHIEMASVVFTDLTDEGGTETA